MSSMMSSVTFFISDNIMYLHYDLMTSLKISLTRNIVLDSGFLAGEAPAALMMSLMMSLGNYDITDDVNTDDITNAKCVCE